MTITTDRGQHRRSPTEMTDGYTALRTPHSVQDPTEATNSAARARAHARVATDTAPTQGERRAAPGGAEHRLGERLRVYWTPPQVWAEPPASLADLTSYARQGEWTRQSGPVRYLGIGYSWLAVAVSTGLYYAAWIVQRPGRLLTALILYALLAQTPIGAWLPWPGWL